MNNPKFIHFKTIVPLYIYDFELLAHTSTSHLVCNIIERDNQYLL